MSATCLDAVTMAMKLGKIISSGETPTSDESADGMVCLQSLYDSWATTGLFGQLRDQVQATSLTADQVMPGTRYLLTNGATITLPSEVTRCDTTDIPYGESFYSSPTSLYPPYDMSLIETWNGSALSRSLYEAGVGSWVELTGLTLSSVAPLATRGLVGLASCLATSEAFLAMFGDEGLSPRVERSAAQFRLSLSYKLGADRPKIPGCYF